MSTSKLATSEKPVKSLPQPWRVAVDRSSQLQTHTEIVQDRKLVVVIPAFNEAETVADVVAAIPRRILGIDEVEVLVVNDGSYDATALESLRAGADAVIDHAGNKGLGVSFRDGLDVALRRRADIIVSIDADGQYDPSEIPNLIQPIQLGQADIVLGDRQTNSLGHMPLGKRVGNWLATKAIRFISGLPILDGQTGFRAFTREAALRLNLNGAYTYTHEVIFQAAEKHLRVAHVPVTFRKRKNGPSRLIPNLWTYAKKSGSILIRTYRDYRPLKIFLSIGLVLIFLGGLFGLRVLIHYIATGSVSPFIPTALLSTILVIVGFQIIVFGLLADMLRSNRQLQEEILYRVKRWESGDKRKSSE